MAPLTRQPLRVTVLAGGGLGHVSGGVGTLMRAMLAAWRAGADAPCVQVIDTRGQGGRAAGALRFAGAALRLAWLCATRRTDLVHAHMTTRGSVVRKGLLCGLAAMLGTPFVVHMHGADFFDFHRRLPPSGRAALGRVLRRAARIVVLGAGWRDFLVREAGLDAARIEILGNGAMLPPPRPPRAAGPPRILFLGRMGDRKGVPELLAALAAPAMAGRAWHATIAGDGEVARFRARREAAGLASRVDMPGWLDGPGAAGLLAQADMLVLPSHHEALPMAVIEALAGGVAVVTTPVGAVAEYLTHGATALLVPPGDAAALGDAMALLLDDAGLRARLASAGHRVFLERLDAAAVGPLLLAIYRAAARPAGGRRGRQRVFSRARAGT